jgi:DNA sulfur modification protein DndD
VEVFRDGVLDPVLTEAWPDHVETLAPRGVANLFFFDGEQIEAFADLEVAGELIRTAIGGLLGLDLVDRLQEDLAILERRKRADATQGEDERRAIQAQQAAVDSMRRRELDARQAIDEAERVLAHAQRAADEAHRRLTAAGGERFQARTDLEGRRREAYGLQRQASAGLLDALGGLGPLLLVETLLEQTTSQASAEQRQADNQVLAELLAERDAVLLGMLRERRAAARTQQQVADFLSEDVAKRKTGDGVATILGTDQQTLRLAQRLVAGELTDERAHLRGRLDDLAETTIVLEQAERAVAAVPAEEAVATILDEHQQATYRVAQAESQVDSARQTYTEAVRRRENAEASFKRQLVEASEALLRSEEAGRLVEHAARASETLATLRAAATARHAKRIEALVLDSLQELLRKDNLISEVKIDPDTCAVELLTHDGRPVRPRTLSAGERQLLAVSLLSGLARASGRLLPVVIDTPLGRLDLDHRHRLIERYLPNASHQVIVLSTDTEITPEMLHRLGDCVSHLVHLAHDRAGGATVVEDGYFSDPTGGGIAALATPGKEDG